MILLKPFKGTRPFNEEAQNIIAPSTDHLSEENIQNIYNKNYWNYLKILNPVGQLKESDTLIAAKNHFSEMKKNEVIKKDENLCYYVYQIYLNNHKQLGFLALANIEDYLLNNIKGHENTYKKRIQDRADQMLNIETQIGPIYMSYPADKNIDKHLSLLIKKKPNYDFYSFDNSHHKLWCVNDLSDIEKLKNALTSISSLYIADGHHRMAAMEIISKKFSNNKKNLNDFMIAAFPSDQSQILDYNRVVKDLNGLNEIDFLDMLSQNFKITKQKKSFKPVQIKMFGMYHNSKWYSLEYIQKKQKKNNILENLDINIINDYCLIPILGIIDINKDDRIRFIAGCHGLKASLENKVDENNDSVAFSIFPSQIEDVMNVANNKLTMPPKSTWFDPKPLDGLVVYEFDQEENN